MKNLTVILLLFMSIYLIFFKDKNEIDINSNFNSYPQGKKEIKIIGLNDFKESDLLLVKKTIDDFYGLNCIIGESLSTRYKDYKFYCEKSQIEMNYKKTFNYNKNKDIKIFVTDFDLYSNDLNVRGICYGNEIYLQSDENLKITTIHEISHSFGLDHCLNNCIMNSYSKIKWCEKSEKPIFCNSCRKILEKNIK
jgi:predicted Zn-dependent protease